MMTKHERSEEDAKHFQEDSRPTGTATSYRTQKRHGNNDATGLQKVERTRSSTPDTDVQVHGKNKRGIRRSVAETPVQLTKEFGRYWDNINRKGCNGPTEV